MSRRFREIVLITGCLALHPAFGWAQAAAEGFRPTGSNAEYHYTLTARIRPLLFWISRSGVGGGSIAWKEEAEGTRQIQLLIGSDPERAPMRINRWGYISESVSGSSLELVGVMTESEEESVEEAEARIKERAARHAFKAIRSTVCGRRAEAHVIHMLAEEDYTYRDLDRLLGQLPATGRPTPTAAVPDGAEPGFLVAVKAMIHRNAERFRVSGKASTRELDECLFVYNGTLFKLTARSSDLHPSFAVRGRNFNDVVETRFQTRHLKTGSTSSFTIAYGISHPIREIPVRIIYRPRWWFEAELELTDAPVARLASREER